MEQELDPFSPLSQAKLRARYGVGAPRKASGVAARIAFSGVLPTDADMLRQVASTLGASVVGDSSIGTTPLTHLVLGRPKPNGEHKRTVKVLFAILSGAWLLPPEWLLLSMDEGRMAPEEAHELDVFPGGLRARRLRQQGKQVLPLAGCKVYVAETDKETKRQLQTLAQAAGAELAATVRGSAVFIGGDAAARARERSGAQALRTAWLYDSIALCEAQAFDAYALAPQQR